MRTKLSKKFRRQLKIILIFSIGFGLVAATNPSFDPKSRVLGFVEAITNNNTKSAVEKNESQDNLSKINNPAERIRATVKLKHPNAEELVPQRTQNSTTYQIGENKFSLDVSMSPLHYKDASGNWREIDTTLQPDSGRWDWKMEKNAFQVYGRKNLGNSDVIEYKSGKEWLRIKPDALQYSNNAGQAQFIARPADIAGRIDGSTITWSGAYGPGLDLSWQVQTARLAKFLRITKQSDLPKIQQFIIDGGDPVLELYLNITLSPTVRIFLDGEEIKDGDADTQGLIEFRDSEGNLVWHFNAPRSWDAELGAQLGTFRLIKQGANITLSHRVPLSFLETAVYPVNIDANVDDQVAAGTDDMYQRESDGLVTDHASVQPGRDNSTNTAFRNWPGWRWASPTGSWPAQGDTIDVAYQEGYFYNTTWDDPYTRIYAQDAASPATFAATTSNISNRTPTTAIVEWNATNITGGTAGWYQTPSLVSVFQELVDSYTITAVVLIWRSGLASGHGDRLYYTYPYNFDTTLAAKLHIEYTAATTGPTNDQLMRHGKWFDGSTEQPFTF